MTAQCPICGRTATDIEATPEQLTYVDGCIHLEVEGVGEAATARFVRREVAGPKPSVSSTLPANEIALAETK